MCLPRTAQDWCLDQTWWHTSAALALRRHTDWMTVSLRLASSSLCSLPSLSLPFLSLPSVCFPSFSFSLLSLSRSILSFFLLCICMCVCARKHGCVHVHIHGQACMCKSSQVHMHVVARGHLRNHPLWVLLRQRLSLAWNSLSRLGCWPASPRDRPDSGITSVHHHIHPF